MSESSDRIHQGLLALSHYFVDDETLADTLHRVATLAL